MDTTTTPTATTVCVSCQQERLMSIGVCPFCEPLEPISLEKNKKGTVVPPSDFPDWAFLHEDDEYAQFSAFESFPIANSDPAYVRITRHFYSLDPGETNGGVVEATGTTYGDDRMELVFDPTTFKTVAMIPTDTNDISIRCSNILHFCESLLRTARVNENINVVIERQYFNPHKKPKLWTSFKLGQLDALLSSCLYTISRRTDSYVMDVFHVESSAVSAAFKLKDETTAKKKQNAIKYVFNTYGVKVKDDHQAIAILNLIHHLKTQYSGTLVVSFKTQNNS